MNLIRLRRGARVITSAVGAVLALALSACTTPSPKPLSGSIAPGTAGATEGSVLAQSDSRIDIASTTSRSPSAEAPADPARHRYLLVQAEQTGLIGVADDGEHTLLRFRDPPVGLEMYDQDGKPLATAIVGTVAGIAGVHEGLLLKRAQASSFATPNHRRRNEPKLSFEEDEQASAVLRELDTRSIAMPAYHLAMRRLKALAPRTSPLASIGLAPAPGAGLSSGLMTELPLESLPPYEKHAQAQSAKGRIIRVFFASGERAVVGPEDGLRRIEDEALKASFVRVTGYTDSTEAGSPLASERARMVLDHLTRRGVQADRIWLGWEPRTRDLADNETVQGRALNRRVEILVQTDSQAPKDARR